MKRDARWQKNRKTFKDTRNKTIEDIKRLLKKHRDELFQKYKIRELGIFGSYARGEQKRGSDIDILIEFDEDNIPDLLEFISIEEDICKLLKRRVDLIRKGSIRDELREKILKEVVYL